MHNINGYFSLNFLNNFNLSSNRFNRSRDNILINALSPIDFRYKKRYFKSTYSLNLASDILNFYNSLFNPIKYLFNKLLIFKNYRFLKPKVFSSFKRLKYSSKYLKSSEHKFIKIKKVFRLNQFFLSDNFKKIQDLFILKYLKNFNNYHDLKFVFILDFFFIWLIIFYKKISYFILDKFYYLFILNVLYFMNNNFNVFFDNYKIKYYYNDNFILNHFNNKFYYLKNNKIVDLKLLYKSNYLEVNPFLRLSLKKINFSP